MKIFLDTTSDEASDEAFAKELEAASRGDEQAVTRLVGEFQPSLLEFAKHRGLSDPEGIVNLTLSAGIGGLGSFRGRDRRAFRAYLYRILRRRIVDDYRRASARPALTSGNDGDQLLEVVDEEASSFDDRVADRQLVEEILDKLTTEQREILEMRVLTGMSIKETAVMTGRSEMAVKSMQRRALLSLRSLVIAAAVVVFGLLGLRLLTMGGEVVVVENGPASGSEEDGSGLPVGVDDGGSDEESVGVLEAEVPEDSSIDTVEIETDEDAADEDTESDDDEGSAVATDDGDTEDEDEAQAAAQVGPSATSEDSSSNRSATLGFAAPCSVITDGTPAVGEVALVTYDFTGPYSLFDGTSADIVGLGDKSALLPGRPDPANVIDGNTLPFVITGNMLPRSGGFQVQTLLAGGEVTTTCDITDASIAGPCVVTTDGTPEVGETASVVYQPRNEYTSLIGQETYIVGADDAIAFRTPTPSQFRNAVKRNFTIDESMVVDDGFEFRTAFADATASVGCRVAG